MNCDQEFGYRPMSEAPRDRQIFVTANMAPFDDAVFMAKAHFETDCGAWVVKDNPPHDLPSLGLIAVNPISWASFMGSSAHDAN